MEFTLTAENTTEMRVLIRALTEIADLRETESVPKLPVVAPLTHVKSTEHVKIGLEEVKESLQKYISVTNVESAVELLQSFGAKRVSDLPVDKYEAFVVRCEENLSGT